MKKFILALCITIASVSASLASDSIALGVRAGSATNHTSYITEVFGDLYLNKLISIGATVAYQMVDHAAKRDESLPITAIAKFHAPLPVLTPYAGLGQAIIFHDKTSATGSPVILAGVDFKPFPMPLFFNLEYRHQFNGTLDILAAGAGVKF